MANYEWQSGMRAMTGELGEMIPDYEQATRAGFFHALNALNAIPGLDPQIVNGEPNPHAVIIERNAAAGIRPFGREPSPSMIRTVLKHVIWVKAHGWDAYVQAMKLPATPGLGDDVKSS